jgi:hypothetical protein
MESNITTPNTPKKRPLGLLIAGGILVVIMLYGIYTNYCKTDALTSSDSSSGITEEILTRIRQLQQDSLASGSSLRPLQNLENLINTASLSLIKEKAALAGKYKLDTTNMSGRLKGDSIFYDSYLSILFQLIDQSLGDLKATSPLYDKLYQIDATNNWSFDKNKNNNSLQDDYLKQLSASYFQIFGLPKSYNNSNSYNKISGADIRTQLLLYSLPAFKSSLEAWQNALQEVLNDIQTRKLDIQARVNENVGKIQILKNELKTMNSLSRDKTIITIALPIFAFLIIILFVIPYIYRSVEVKNDDGTQSINILYEIFSKGLLLKIFTVFLLTIAIILLALGDKIQGETIGTLLGGISVYILQNSFGKPDSNGNGDGNSNGNKAA